MSVSRKNKESAQQSSSIEELWCHVELMAQHILKQGEKKLEEEDERNASHYSIQLWIQIIYKS